MQIKEYTESIETLTSLFKGLGDETRLRILNLLREGELCVCHIEQVLKQPQSKVSRHLFLLKASGFVRARREAHWVFYSLRNDEKSQGLLHCLWRYIGDNRTFMEDIERLQQLRDKLSCK